MTLSTQQDTFLRTLLLLANRTIIERLSNPNSTNPATRRTLSVFRTKENFFTNFKHLTPAKWGNLKNDGVFLSDYIENQAQAEEYVNVLREISPPNSGYIACYAASPQRSGAYRMFFKIIDLNEANQWAEIPPDHYNSVHTAAREDAAILEKVQALPTGVYGSSVETILSNGKITLFRAREVLQFVWTHLTTEQDLVGGELKICLLDTRETALYQAAIVKDTNHNNCHRLVMHALGQNKYKDLGTYFKQYDVPVTTQWFYEEQGLFYEKKQYGILYHAVEKLDQNLIRIALELYKNNDYQVNPQEAQRDQQAAISFLIARLGHCNTRDEVFNLVVIGGLLEDNFDKRPAVEARVASFLEQHLRHDTQIAALRPVTIEGIRGLPTSAGSHVTAVPTVSSVYAQTGAPAPRPNPGGPTYS